MLKNKYNANSTKYSVNVCKKIIKDLISSSWELKIGEKWNYTVTEVDVGKMLSVIYR